MPLVTIIIPTHDRQDYALVAARKIMEVMPSAQLVVSDTSADPRLGTMIAELDIPGVEYVRPNRPMDVVSHFEFALDFARGRYVMFLGDDDCIGPGLEEVAIWADRHGIDAVLSYGAKFNALYYWPGVTSQFYGSGYASRLFVHRFSGKARRIDPERARQDVLRDLGRGLGDMPRIYHGLVSRKLIARVKDRFGSLFGGVSPDIYSATLLSELADRVWMVDFPFCLPGGSPASTAGSGVANTDRTSLTQHPHTAAFADLRWDPLIPAFYAPYIVWSYSLKKAVDRLGRSDLHPNFARIYALSLMKHRAQRGAIADAIAAAREEGLAAGSGSIAWEIAREMAFQVKRYGSRILSPKAGGGAELYGGLQDIAAAYDCLQRHIDDHSIRLQLPDRS